MKIVQLEYFCAVSQCHSITQAAQKLYVTQPAISNAIKELEKEFSVSLFVRSKNHMTLTTESQRASGFRKADNAAVLRPWQTDSSDPYRDSPSFEHDFFP